MGETFSHIIFSCVWLKRYGTDMFVYQEEKT